MTGCGLRVSNQLKSFTSTFKASCSAAITFLSISVAFLSPFLARPYLSRYSFADTMGLSRVNRGAPSNASGRASRETPRKMDGRTPVDTKAILSARDLGKTADRVESVYCSPIVKAVLLERMRIALMDSTCVSMSDRRLFIWILSCLIS